MGLADALHVTRGVSAVVGSGGKTTLLATLARELAGHGARVALTTTTHVRPFPGMPCLVDPAPGEVAAALADAPVVCVGGACGDAGKLRAPALAPEELAELADYVLAEADGARQLPLKAHASWEPVVPAGARQTILVVGAGGLFRPVCEAVHRPEVFCGLAGCAADDAATPELVACVLRAEGLATRVLVNQADTPGLLDAARALAGGLDVPVVAGSLRAGRLTELRA